MAQTAFSLCALPAAKYHRKLGTSLHRNEKTFRKGAALFLFLVQIELHCTSATSTAPLQQISNCTIPFPRPIAGLGSLHEWWAPQDQVDLLLRPSVRRGFYSPAIPSLDPAGKTEEASLLTQSSHSPLPSIPSDREGERERRWENPLSSLFHSSTSSSFFFVPPFPSFCSLSFRVPFFPLRPPPTPSDPYFDPQSASPSQSLTTFWRRRADGRTKGVEGSERIRQRKRRDFVRAEKSCSAETSRPPSSNLRPIFCF